VQPRRATGATSSWTMRWCCALVCLALQSCAGATGATRATEPRSVTNGDRRAEAPGRPPEGAQEVRIDGELIARRVARDAYVITHVAGLVPANVLAVQMPDGTLLVCSSPYETESTHAMLRWLRDTFRPPRIVAINTHFHPDGTGGNDAYQQAGVETYASDSTQALLATRGAEVRDATAQAMGPPLRARMERMQIVPALHTFAAQNGLTLTFGGESVQVFYPGPAHSPDNVVVYFPARELLFGGCMIRAASAKLGYTGDADIENWAAAVRSIERFAPRIVVPGHGDPGGIELLQHTIDLALAAQSGHQP
jgi:metallo-beta-lactamase class B